MADFFRPKNYAMKINPTLKYAWINIPKNASSFIQKVLDDNSWVDVPEDLIVPIAESPNIEKLVILRDPIKRWISGLAQCMSERDISIDLLDDNDFIQTIFLNPVFDDHTEYQHRFIGNATNLKYIYMQNDNPQKFYRLLASWIKSTNGIADFDNYTEPVNPASNNKDKLAIHNKLDEMFSKNVSLLRLHKRDYNILDQHTKYKGSQIWVIIHVSKF